MKNVKPSAIKTIKPRPSVSQDSKTQDKMRLSVQTKKPSSIFTKNQFDSPDKASLKNQSLVDPNSPFRIIPQKTTNQDFQQDLDSPFRRNKEVAEVRTSVINLQKISEFTPEQNSYQSHFNNLQKTPIISKFSVKTKAGQTEKKVSKINQDSYIQLSNFMDNQEIHIFAVCDGHGQFGHQVS